MYCISEQGKNKVEPTKRGPKKKKKRGAKKKVRARKAVGKNTAAKKSSEFVSTSEAVKTHPRSPKRDQNQTEMQTNKNATEETLQLPKRRGRPTKSSKQKKMSPTKPGRRVGRPKKSEFVKEVNPQTAPTAPEIKPPSM